MPENLCAKAGCKGDCCKDLTFPKMDITKLNATFPDAVKLENNDDVDPEWQVVDKPNGVYFSDQGNEKAKVIINGNCPHLTSNGSCGIFGQENRPDECSEVQIGSQICAVGRIIEGHSPIIPIDQIL